MAFLAFWRPILIVLVPIINFVFLALFIYSPSSLPRLPGSSSLFSKVSTAILYDEPEPIEYIDFNRKIPSQNEHGHVGSRGQYGDSIADNTAGHGSYSGPNLGSGSDNGPSYLLAQRKLVEGIELTPLPDHLITTYRPGYYEPPPPLIPPHDQAATPLEDDTNNRHAQDRDIDLDPSTKYLTFLPHSGFHNQRTELENALLLARLLNRTLIMPKVYLGPPMPWLRFKVLYSRLLYQTKIGLEHCQAIIENQEEEVIEYEEELEQQPEQVKPGMDMMAPQVQGRLPFLPRPSPSSLEQFSASDEQAQLQLHQDKQRSLSQQKQQKHHHHQRKHHYHRQQPYEDMQFQQDAGFIQEDHDEVPASISTKKLSSDLFEEVDVIPETYQESTKTLPDIYGDEGDEDVDDGDGESILGLDPILQENDGEEEETSWVEEPEGGDEEGVRVATGDVVGDVLDLEDTEENGEDDSDDGSGQDVRDWEAVEEDDGERYDTEGFKMGIIEDLEEDGSDWYPDSVMLSDQADLYGNSNRLLSQQMDDEASLPLYMPPLNSEMQDGHPQMGKRSLTEDRLASLDRLKKRQLPDPLQQEAVYPQHNVDIEPTERQQQPSQRTVRKQRRVKWSPLPTECLQYESWTMTDWDMFFDLNPLRHYVRILTRESMSMAYLANRFNLTLLREEEPKLNETTTELGSESTDESVTKEEENDSGSEDGESGGDEGEEGKEKKTLLRSEGDVLFFDDNSLYDYHFTENATSKDSFRSKFRDEFTVEWLADRPERLIHLGSIFGTGRIYIESLESKAWLQMIRDHLILRTDILQKTSQRIADKISGGVVQQLLHHQQNDDDAYPGQQTYYGQQSLSSSVMEAGFVGVHIRISDGHFSLTARDTIENIRQELMWQIGITEDNGDNGEDEDEDESSPHFPSNASQAHKRQGRLSVEQCRSRALNHRRALQEQLGQHQEQDQQAQPYYQQPHGQGQGQGQQHAFLHTPDTSVSPPKRRSNGRFTPIYLATDARRPRANPIFDKLFETFSCIFTLDDFEEDLELLHQFRNPEDGTLMAKFLIPMVDAMVAAKSAAFFGTPTSTFSNYIQKQLHPAFTGLYD
ncbi:hypothetical protein BGZ58_002257 [Dissophora ornata]|nr:hypothetical protein BGZ58_002257 [Dissophora ornata]